MKPEVTVNQPEFWQTGPVAGIPGLLQPVAHTLLQVQREISPMLENLNPGNLWDKPAGAASPGFHLQHMCGVLDRLFTYASGAELTAEQLRYLGTEGEETVVAPGELLERFNQRVAAALKQLSVCSPDTLTEIRFVGRKKIPSTQLGLFFHAAEHLMRHTGQLLVTVRFLSQP